MKFTVRTAHITAFLKITNTWASLALVTVPSKKLETETTLRLMAVHSAVRIVIRDRTSRMGHVFVISSSCYQALPVGGGPKL